jgi:hypothetical protein
MNKGIDSKWNYLAEFNIPGTIKGGSLGIGNTFKVLGPARGKSPLWDIIIACNNLYILKASFQTSVKLIIGIPFFYPIASKFNFPLLED